MSSFCEVGAENPAVAAGTAPCPSLLAELTLATPGGYFRKEVKKHSESIPEL